MSNVTPAEPRTHMAYLSRRYPSPGLLSDKIWVADQRRIQDYLYYWRFYDGQHWSWQPEEPVVTANYIELFVNKHARYLFGKGFEIHASLDGQTNDKAADFLSINWQKNDETLTWEMAVTGGVTGDCWVSVGYDNDAMVGERFKYTVWPSEFCFPIFTRATDREPSALAIIWSDVEIVRNDFGTVQTKPVQRGYYWTKQASWELLDGEPVGEARPNPLGELPFVHISNMQHPKTFWGIPDIKQIVDLNRELNEKFTNASDIVNYHASPITLIYGAKASTLERGENKIWGGLPESAKVENLQLNDTNALDGMLDRLKDTLLELGDTPRAAMGGNEAISNTSGVAISLQFAPLIEHMERRRMSYGRGIRRLNYLTLRYAEMLGIYRPSRNARYPYYSGLKWADPLPRYKQIQLQNLLTLHQSKIIARAHVLREAIANDLAPGDLDFKDIDKTLKDAEEEFSHLQEAEAKAASAGEPAPQNPDFAANQTSIDQQLEAETSAAA